MLSAPTLPRVGLVVPVLGDLVVVVAANDEVPSHLRSPGASPGSRLRKNSTSVKTECQRRHRGRRWAGGRTDQVGLVVHRLTDRGDWLSRVREEVMNAATPPGRT